MEHKLFDYSQFSSPALRKYLKRAANQLVSKRAAETRAYLWTGHYVARLYSYVSSQWDLSREPFDEWLLIEFDITHDEAMNYIKAVRPELLSKRFSPVDLGQWATGSRRKSD